MEKTEETRSAEGTIEIGASPERVWRALTDPRELERWFPLEARVEPGPGGSVWLSWKNEFAGLSEIVAWRPPHVLAYAWGWSEDAPPQVTEYVLEGDGGSTLLRVVTSGFPADASWDDMVEGTRTGWSFELRSLKAYLERHDGESRHVAYVRRRVPLPSAEIGRRLFGDEGLAARHAPAGSTFDLDSPLQHACVMERPPDGLFRLSNEPSYGEAARVVTVFASAWGPVAQEVAALGEEWRGRLAEAFPEGEALEN
ncbi:MAG TPA: SRPBCC domain-containing protein [Longimicrobiales bacterium]|nr:SRPBCC domain-containing protein [Longimicrobiales bacterium]